MCALIKVQTYSCSATVFAAFSTTEILDFMAWIKCSFRPFCVSVFLSQEGQKQTEQANFSLEHPLSMLARMSEISCFPIQSPALSAGRKPWKVVVPFKSSCCPVCSANHCWLQENGGTKGLGISSQHHCKAAVFCLSLFRLVSFCLCLSPSACHCFKLVFSSLLISLSPQPTCWFSCLFISGSFGPPLHTPLSLNSSESANGQENGAHWKKAGNTQRDLWWD